MERDEAGANHKAAESFPRFAVRRVGSKEGIEFGDDAGVVKILKGQLRRLRSRGRHKSMLQFISQIRVYKDLPIFGVLHWSCRLGWV
jgi:hypothetical protein